MGEMSASILKGDILLGHHVMRYTPPLGHRDLVLCLLHCVNESLEILELFSSGQTHKKKIGGINPAPTTTVAFMISLPSYPFWIPPASKQACWFMAYLVRGLSYLTMAFLGHGCCIYPFTDKSGKKDHHRSSEWQIHSSLLPLCSSSLLLDDNQRQLPRAWSDQLVP